MFSRDAKQNLKLMPIQYTNSFDFTIESSMVDVSKTRKSECVEPPDQTLSKKIGTKPVEPNNEDYDSFP